MRDEVNGIQASMHLDQQFHGAAQPLSLQRPEVPENDLKVREAFNDFVGQTFYGQMLGAMRKTVGEPAYLHGGRAEEIFRNQLDQVLVEKMSDASAESFTGPMFDLFSLPRR